MNLLFDNFEMLVNSSFNAAKLKELIMQLAVQGKLVEQDPNDEPANKLLEKIKEDKAKLIREGKLKKEAPLPAITEAEIRYKLPDGWVWCRLGEIGIANPRNQANNELDVSFIPMTLISNKYGIIPKFEITKWNQIKSGFTHFADNDVVVAKITPCFENSKAGIIKGLKNKIGAGTTELHVFRTICAGLIPDYVYLYFKSPQFLENGKMSMTGTAGQQRIPKDYIFQTPFPLPPTDEQHRIVAKVEKLMSLCDTLEEQIVRQKEMHQKLMMAVVRDAVKSNLKN